MRGSASDRCRRLLLGLLALGLGCPFVAAAQEPEPVTASDTVAVAASVPEARPAERASAGRRLDLRAHRGYEGWARGIPTHVKGQYAGGMGIASVGAGWDYGRKCRWETDLMVGLLPRGYTTSAAHLVFTLRQNYIPWSIRTLPRLDIEPFTCGLYMTLIAGQDFWVRVPDRYPTSDYYCTTSRLRIHAYVGQRVTWHVRRASLLRAITLYYELSINDLDLISKVGNRTLGMDDICYFSLGVKFQLMR